MPNFGSDTVSVVDTATNTVVTIIPVGDGPESVAVAPDGAFVYVVNNRGGTVSVISTSSNTVVATAPVGANPRLVTVTPDGKRAWVMGFGGTSDDDFADAEAMAAIVRITSGNFRLLDRLLSQVVRLVALNRLHFVTEDVVNTARSMLVVGT